MRNKKAEEVIKRLEKENETFSIRILGDKENKDNAFTILMNCKEGFNAFGKEDYAPINKKTIELLKKAEIKFKILK